ncbi:MAG: choice-of-anchor L domain-containing protein [Planctomycetes bacterium]|nr:choice-of-anchor L domain-containing protein [Planctomycetota bacterium]
MNLQLSPHSSFCSSLVPLLVTSAAVLGLALPGLAQRRLELPPGGSNWVPQQSLVAGLTTTSIGTGGLTPAGVVQALVGPGVTITNVQYTGAPVAAGTFAGGTGIIGFAQGVVLSSGNVASVAGPSNVDPATSTDNLRPGDADLDALVGGLTEDATVLEFDFECPTTSVFSFQYVFTSEEYDEWVNTQYNDVFAFFLNGQNIALIPGTSTPVAINNVNCDNPYNPGSGQNCALYTTNDCTSLGLGYPCTGLATEMDGLTVVFSATGTLHPGPNHIKLAIADRGDRIYDSNVFIRGESFVCAPAGPAFDPPSPCGQTLVAFVGATLAFEVETIATSGMPGQTVVLSVAGDPAPLSGGAFVPPLPAGPAASVRTEFHWSPTGADLGLHHLVFTSTDQLGQFTTCDVWIDVVPSQIHAYCFGDGSGTACPCGNHSQTGEGQGCLNSTGKGGLLKLAGTPSVGNDTATLEGEKMPNSSALYFQGTARVNGGAGAVFGDGLQCAGGAVIRLATKTNVAGKSQFPSNGDPLLSVRGAVTSGATRMYQVWYRNAADYCTASTFNLTNALEVTWAP